MKDYRPGYGGLEPQDFTRIHDSDLKELRATLHEMYSTVSHPRFTDRHGYTERIKAVLDKKDVPVTGHQPPPR
jgi:hypothetical protein